MLISANMKIPKKVFGHGFLTREGQKMGKSLGNVLDPDLLLKKYGNDPVRWYLIKDISCLLYTSPSPRDLAVSRMPSSA